MIRTFPRKYNLAFISCIIAKSTMNTKRATDFLKRHRDIIIISMLFITLPILAFWKNFDFTGLNLSFFNADFIGFYYPDFSLGVSLFGKFKDMLWDPYNMMGIPHIGGVDRVGLFYPLKFIFYFIGSFVNPANRLFLITYFSVLHITIACFSFFIFSRKILNFSNFQAFFASLIFGFNGTFIRLIALPNHMLSVAYLPLILYFLHRAITEKKIYLSLWAGVFMSPVLLSGYTPVFIYNSLFAGLYILLNFYKKRLVLFRATASLCLVVLVAVLIATPALLPNLENASLSERQKYNIVGSSNNQLLPVTAVHYIFPGFFEASEGVAGIVYGYVGIGALILALIAISGYENIVIRNFVIILLIFLTLSFGRATFLHSFAYLVVPKYSFFRLPGILNYLVGFCFACLAGFGLKKIISKDGIHNYVKTFLFSGGIMLISLLLLSYIAKVVYMSNNKIDTAIDAIFFTNLFYFFSLFTLFLLHRSSKSTVARVLLVSILVIDLFTLVSKSGMSNGEIDPRIFTGNNDLIHWFRDNTSDYSRTDLRDLSVRYNSAEAKLYQIGGYYGLYPQTFTLFFQNYLDSSIGGYKPDSKALDIAGVKYVTTSKELDPNAYSGLKKVKTFTVEKSHKTQFMDASGSMIPEGTVINVYQNEGYFPKLTLYTNTVLVPDDLSAANLLEKVDSAKTIVITSSESKYLVINQGSGEQNKAVLKKYTNSEVIAQTDTDSEAVLMLNDVYYPGWKVTIDNKKADLVKANVTFRGVLVPAGLHTIRFYYQPSKLFTGILTSFFAWAVIVYVTIFKRSGLYDTNKQTNNHKS